MRSKLSSADRIFIEDNLHLTIEELSKQTDVEIKVIKRHLESIKPRKPNKKYYKSLTQEEGMVKPVSRKNFNKEHIHIINPDKEKY